MSSTGDKQTEKQLYDAFWETDAGREWDRKNRNFGMRVRSDGTFEAPAVPPDEYEVNVRVGEPRSPSKPFGRILGSARQKLTVPDGEGDFDIGTISVKPRS